MAAVTPTISRTSLFDTTLPRGGGEEGMDLVLVAKGTDSNNFIPHVSFERWGFGACSITLIQ